MLSPLRFGKVESYKINVAGKIPTGVSERSISRAVISAIKDNYTRRDLWPTAIPGDYSRNDEVRPEDVIIISNDRPPDTEHRKTSDSEGEQIAILGGDGQDGINYLIEEQDLIRKYDQQVKDAGLVSESGRKFGSFGDQISNLGKILNYPFTKAQLDQLDPTKADDRQKYLLIAREFYREHQELIKKYVDQAEEVRVEVGGFRREHSYLYFMIAKPGIEGRIIGDLYCDS